jgi:hypothetical protein
MPPNAGVRSRSALAPAGRCDALDAHASARLWQRIGAVDFCEHWADSDLVWRIWVAPSQAAELIATAARDTAMEWFFDWAGGQIWIRLRDPSDDGGARSIRSAVARHPGAHATLVRAPEAMRARTDPFHPLSPGLTALTARIKRAFDPGACSILHACTWESRTSCKRISVPSSCRTRPSPRRRKSSAAVCTAAYAPRGCGTMVKDYGFMLRRDPAYAERARRISALARDVSEFVAAAGLELRRATVPPLRVAYQAACSLQHGQRIRRQPRDLLEGAGFTVLDIAEDHLCCGSAGTYSILQPALANRLRARKLAHIASSAPDVVASGNIGCISHLAQDCKLPIVHTVELLDWASGGPAPPALAASPFTATGSKP